MQNKIYVYFLFVIFLILLVPWQAQAASTDNKDIPVKGTVTMADFGAKKCIPCKMMAPILEKLEKVYRGKAAIIFIDVWENQEMARKFGIRAIPTQIFYDKNGNEVWRHSGFLGEPEIIEQLKKIGVE